MIEEHQKLNRYLHGKMYGEQVVFFPIPDYYGDADILLHILLSNLPGQIAIDIDTTGQAFRVNLRDRANVRGVGLSQKSVADALARATYEYLTELEKYAPTPDTSNTEDR